jgi:hypothetical protein
MPNPNFKEWAPIFYFQKIGAHFRKNEKFEFLKNGHPFKNNKTWVPIFQKSGTHFLNFGYFRCILNVDFSFSKWAPIF